MAVSHGVKLIAEHTHNIRTRRGKHKEGVNIENNGSYFDQVVELSACHLD